MNIRITEIISMLEIGCKPDSVSKEAKKLENVGFERIGRIFLPTEKGTINFEFFKADRTTKATIIYIS